ncbi:hypothetical protein MSTHT_0899 [Methanosarcina thermophila TM-1]|nr:hypothetical protein MSTHT_0899 [Methanosarcina thermophila TM-1]
MNNENESIKANKLSRLSSSSRKTYDLNEEIIQCNRLLNDPYITKRDKAEYLEWKQTLEDKVIEWWDINTECLQERNPESWVLELDRKAFEVMLKNIHNGEETDIFDLLFDKHRIHIECFPRDLGSGEFGMQFYCPICEDWHLHGIGEGHRVAHCRFDGFHRYGEKMPRDNPLQEHGYVIKMMNEEDLRRIRDEIDAYLTYTESKGPHNNHGNFKCDRVQKGIYKVTKEVDGKE